mmetsp:Transcript_40351/g.46231  ORF Transcript_40351/g.46231 Transcript_40351/m.46231 type:complete len:291 (-) Transcript_40351:685-1557(-)
MGNTIKAQKALEDGLGHYQAGNLDVAAEEFKKAIDYDPRSAKAHFNTGLISYRRGEFVTAINEFTACLSIDDRHAKSYFQRGLANYRLKQFNKAILDYSMAVKYRENHSLGYYNRGLANYHSLNFHHTIFDCSMAIKIDSSYDRAWNNRGLAYFQLHKYEDALIDLKVAQKLNSNDYTYHNFANTHYRMQNNQLAIYYYTITIAHAPNDANLHMKRALAYKQNNKLQEASKDLRQSLRIRMRPRPLMELTMCQGLVKSYKTAAKTFERAILINPRSHSQVAFHVDTDCFS